MPSERDVQYELLEACYRVTTVARWTQHLLSIAQRSLDTGHGLGISVIVETGSKTRRVETLAAVGDVHDTFVAATGLAVELEERAYRAMYYPRSPIVRASKAFQNTGGSQRVLSYIRSRGVPDAWGVLAHPRFGTVMVLTAAVANSVHASHRQLRSLKVLQTHLESGLRLLLSGNPEPLAIFAPSGGLLHAAEGAQTGDAQRLLSQAARSIESVRDGRDAAAERWKAIVDGRWTLVPRTDSDGRRSYHAYENPRESSRTLAWHERAVLARLIAGRTHKEVAFERHVDPSVVSRTVSAILMKLGFRSQAELFRFAERFAPCALPNANLTQAELEVAQLLSQGKSNQQIAKARSTSVRTVANQIASILRKTGAPGRNAIRTPPATEAS